MATHPVNLVVRFLLELSALFALGLWGWHGRDDGWRILVALAIPTVAAALWGIFAVPHDPTRSGAAPIPVSGLVRLALELGFFGCATLALNDLGFGTLTAILGTAVVVHYVFSYDRIRWLVGQ
jgi:Protein of unknown function (DUF2568)